MCPTRHRNSPLEDRESNRSTTCNRPIPLCELVCVLCYANYESCPSSRHTRKTSSPSTFILKNSMVPGVSAAFLPSLFTADADSENREFQSEGEFCAYAAFAWQRVCGRALRTWVIGLPKDRLSCCRGREQCSTPLPLRSVISFFRGSGLRRKTCGAEMRVGVIFIIIPSEEN